jgi:hypothetical protein
MAAAECRHVMPRGVKCHSPALGGKSYCYYHDRLHIYRRDGCREDDNPLALPYLEDANGIQLALMQVLGAIGTGRLGRRRGGMMLYGLQIAIQALDRTPAVPSGEMVEIADSDESDLELGLELGMESGMEQDRCETDKPGAACKQASCTNKQTTRQVPDSEVQDRKTQDREIQDREIQDREVQDREVQDRQPLDSPTPGRAQSGRAQPGRTQLDPSSPAAIDVLAIQAATPRVIPLGSAEHRRLVRELIAEAKLVATRAPA